MKSLKARYGSWAVVTGATSGIGRAFADALARRGLNVVLVARGHGDLQQACEAIRARHGVEALPLPLDLAAPDAAERLDRDTSELDVGLLVNNAAVEQRGAFLRHATEELHRAIALNVTTPTELGRRFGRRFVARGRGGIVFLAGIVGHQGVPHLASYAASKAHQLTLAEALHYELRPYGVDVLGLSPGLTRTAMVDRLRTSIRFGRIGMLALRPERVVRAGLNRLGRSPSIVVGLQYRFFAMLTKRILSRAAGARLFGALFRLAFRDKQLLDPRADRAPALQGARSVPPAARERPTCRAATLASRD